MKHTQKSCAKALARCDSERTERTRSVESGKCRVKKSQKAHPFLFHSYVDVGLCMHADGQKNDKWSLNVRPYGFLLCAKPWEAKLEVMNPGSNGLNPDNYTFDNLW